MAGARLTGEAVSAGVHQSRPRTRPAGRAGRPPRLRQGRPGGSWVAELAPARLQRRSRPRSAGGVRPARGIQGFFNALGGTAGASLPLENNPMLDDRVLGAVSVVVLGSPSPVTPGAWAWQGQGRSWSGRTRSSVEAPSPASRPPSAGSALLRHRAESPSKEGAFGLDKKAGDVRGHREPFGNSASSHPLRSGEPRSVGLHGPVEVAPQD